MMAIGLYIIFIMMVVALLPSAVFASVVIHESTIISITPKKVTTAVTNPITIVEGPDYKTANAMGLITLTNKTTTSGNDITFGYVGNGSNETLPDILEIENISKVNATMSLSNTKNVSLYYSSLPATEKFPTSHELGTPVSTSGATSHLVFNTTPTTHVWYVSAVITGSVTNNTFILTSAGINKSYSVNTIPVENHITLKKGPGYSTSHQLGLVILTNETATSNQTITFGYPEGVNYVNNTNVFEIKNNSKINAPTYIQLSVSSTKNITFYYKSTQVTEPFPTTSELGAPVSTTGILLHTDNNSTSTASVWYLADSATGTVTKDTLTMSYSIGGIVITTNVGYDVFT